jgi:hypothetical protein
MPTDDGDFSTRPLKRIHPRCVRVERVRVVDVATYSIQRAPYNSARAPAVYHLADRISERRDVGSVRLVCPPVNGDGQKGHAGLESGSGPR